VTIFGGYLTMKNSLKKMAPFRSIDLVTNSINKKSLYRLPLWRDDKLSDASQFYESLSDVYEEFSKHQDKDGKIADFLNNYTNGKDVLDFGCGTGKFIHQVAPSSKSYTGIDVADGQLLFSKSKAKEHDNVHVFKYSGEKIPLVSNSMDVIFATWVLGSIHNLELREKLLSELKRILRPNGVLLVVTNNIGGDFKHIIEEGFGDEKTLHKLNWMTNFELEIYKPLTIHFEFKSIDHAQGIFTKIWGARIAQKIRSHTFSHEVLVLKWER
jgi:ubiquinone/menaquinone biosynthesis C-methylase UbiE